MSAGTRWRRLDAEHWVWVLCLVHTTLLTIYVGVLPVQSLALGMPLPFLLLCAVPVVGAGWLTSAWRRERP